MKTTTETIRSLHILHLEDDPRDAALIRSTMEEEGIDCTTTCVTDREAFVSALEQGGVDLVLSDFSLPAFDGLSAIAIVRARWPEVPVILVSGTLGEEQAVESLKSGATDYVLKDRLARLAPAVRRAVREAEEHGESRRMKMTLEETEQRFRMLFRQSPLGIALVGVDGRPVLTNAALQEMLGYTGDELNRMPFADFTLPEDRAEGLGLFQELIQGARKSYKIEKRYVRKDGQVIRARLTVNVAREAVGQIEYVMGMVEDITEGRRMEAQFIEAQKMEVLGKLASGVAHDFNNVLGVILMCSDLIATGLGPDSPLLEYSEEIGIAANRAVGLTRQLLVFSREQPVQPVVLDLNVVVKDLDKMLRRLVGETIALTTVAGEQIGRIKANPGYVGQVLMNLAVNARDAMPRGGKLTIATSNVTIDENQAQPQTGAKAGDYVILSVGDTGTGMTDEVKARMFEAFFTTKPSGRGTGLGLATCQTIVRQCGGHIGVQSELGRGTTFRIYFPRVEEALDIAASPIPTGPLPRGTETLLVVEDEPSVRHLAAGVLEAQGYTTLRAANGQDGLRVAGEHQGSPIRLVVTDVMMPLMGGKVMVEWLRTTDPDLKILFTSGYTDDALAQGGVLETGVQFLPKPYTPATLIRRVREMLDEKGGQAVEQG